MEGRVEAVTGKVDSHLLPTATASMPSPPSSKQRRSDTTSGGLLEQALLEVRPRLQSAYCFLRLAVDTGDPTFRLISVQTRGERPGLDVCLEYRGQTYTESVDVDCRLAGLSGGVSVTGRYMVLRASLEPDERRGSTAAEAVPAETAQPAPMPLWRPTVPSRYCATCRQCGAAAVDARFHRALPLPSENWREMLGNIFCHGDGADRSIHDRVRARPGDCFYAASHVVLSAEDIDCNASADGRLSCAGCSAPLGEKVEFGARLWHHRLTWSQNGVRELRLEPRQVLRRLLVHGANMCDAPAARLLASAPRHEPLLMWLIDTSLAVHVTRTGEDADDDSDVCSSDGGATTGKSGTNQVSGDNSDKANGGNNGNDVANDTNGTNGTSHKDNTNGANGTNGTDDTKGTNGTGGTDDTKGTNGTNGMDDTKGTNDANGTNDTNGTSGGGNDIQQDMNVDGKGITSTKDRSGGVGLKESSSARSDKSPGRARTAVKVLYRRCDDDAARQHRADLSVKSLELDEALMAALRSELERSQRWYPELQRTQGEDQVGLIVL